MTNQKIGLTDPSGNTTCVEEQVVTVGCAIGRTQPVVAVTASTVQITGRDTAVARSRIPYTAGYDKQPLD